MPTSMTIAPSLTWLAVISAGLADGDDENLRPARVGGQVLGGDVAKRDGRHLLGQQQGDRLAGDFAGADDDGLGPAKRDARRFDQFDDGQRRAGGDERVAIDDVADVGGIDAFHVLDRVDLILHFRRIEMAAAAAGAA